MPGQGRFGFPKVPPMATDFRDCHGHAFAVTPDVISKAAIQSPRGNKEWFKTAFE
jgi:hypothetical protein